MNFYIFAIFLTISQKHINCEATSNDQNLNAIKNVVQNKIKVGKDCENDLRRIYGEKLTIMRMVSSWSHFNPNHKYGNSHDFGDFLGCKSINGKEVSTQYCLVQYFNDKNPPNPIPPFATFYQREFVNLDVSFLGAVCMPNSCSSKDVKEIVKSLLDEQNLRLGENIFCKNDVNQKPALIWGRILLYALILSLTVIFQVIGIPKLKFTRILMDFLTFDANSSPTAYLNGIKASVSIWIFLLHTWYFRAMFPFKNGRNTLEFHTNFPEFAFILANTLMEIFFIIGGMLCTKSLAKDFESCTKFKWIVKFYIKRAMRLLPVVLLVLALVATFDDKNSGPYSFPEEKENCKKYWWAFIGLNFLHPKNHFASYCWFIAVYFQLLIASPIIFILIKCNKSYIAASIFIMLGSIYAKINHVYSFLPTIMKLAEKGMSYSDEAASYYLSIQYRFLPFFGGMILEKFLSSKKSTFEIKNLPFLKPTLILAAILLIYFMRNDEHKRIAIIDTLNILILFATIYYLQNSNGILKKFLSLKFWTLVSKMGLSIYLMCSYLLHGIHRNLTEPLEIGNFNEFVVLIFGDIVRASAPVILTFLFIEEPFARIGEFLTETTLKNN